MNLLLMTTLLLLAAVMIGSYLVFIGMRRKKRIPALGLTHAALATSGIIVLCYEIFTGPTDKLNNLAALFLFFAIVGGGMVFALREDNRPPPMAGVIAHAIMGVIGVCFLLFNL